MHDSESQMDVDNCADPGCYSRKIKYEYATLRQMSALAELSSECHQSIKVRLPIRLIIIFWVFLLHFAKTNNVFIILTVRLHRSAFRDTWRCQVAYSWWNDINGNPPDCGWKDQRAVGVAVFVPSLLARLRVNL